jgi:hypothetical protein
MSKINVRPKWAAVLIAFARRCEGLFRRRIPVQEDADFHAIRLMRRGCQYYAAARFAMHAQCMPVLGNLFHHAVEMILKGGLARKRKLSGLKDMGHDLKKLWRAYKADFPGPTPKRHDKTISDLNKFEDIRYPDANQHAMGWNAAWCGPAGEVTWWDENSKPKTLKQYTLVVSEIDDLIVDALKMSNWNPVAFCRVLSARSNIATWRHGNLRDTSTNPGRLIAEIVRVNDVDPLISEGRPVGVMQQTARTSSPT